MTDTSTPTYIHLPTIPTPQTRDEHMRLAAQIIKSPEMMVALRLDVLSGIEAEDDFWNASEEVSAVIFALTKWRTER